MHIEGYEFGKITIGGDTYRSDVIIWPEGVNDSWWRVEGHRLCKEDLEPVLDKRPEALVIGTGAHGAMLVPQEIVRYMLARCEEVHIERTAAAVKIYNDLTGGDRRVVAALHLTC
ncbi:MAG: Mth938-like domain-containing protein [Planctomycetota bacterium]|jgi:hypothetical protein